MTHNSPTEPEKRRLPWVRIAAILVILATAGILIFQQKQRQLIVACHVYAGEPEEALGACDTLLTWMARAPATVSLIHRHKMRVHMYQKDWGSAENEADLAIAADPKSSIPWQWKADILSRAGDDDGALAAIDAALNLEPANRYSLRKKYKLLSKLGRLEDLDEMMGERIRAGDDLGRWMPFASIQNAVTNPLEFSQTIAAFQEKALALREDLVENPLNLSLRKQFVETCNYLGPNCPPLFPEKRDRYPVLTCEDAIKKWAEQYPKMAETILADSGYETLDDFFDKGGFSAKAIVQAIYLGPALAIMQRNSTDEAKKLIVDSRMFDCVNGGVFVYTEGQVDDAERYFTKEHLYGPELRRNLVDLAHIHPN